MLRLSGFVSPVKAVRIVAAAREHQSSSGPARAARESKLLELVLTSLEKTTLGIEFPEHFPGNHEVFS